MLCVTHGIHVTPIATLSIDIIINNHTYHVMCNSRYRRYNDSGAVHGYAVEGNPVARYAESDILNDSIMVCSIILMNLGSA